MAGELTIDTLHSTVEPFATGNAFSGIAKAWVNFNGANGAIRSSFNVGSVVKNGTGDYTINLTAAMSNANYSVLGMQGGTAGGVIIKIKDGTVLSQSNFTINVVASNFTNFDSAYAMCAVFA